MRSTVTALPLALLLVALLGWAAVAAPVGWLGDGTSVYPAATAPLTIDGSQGVRWSAELPDWGNASPVVVGDRVIVTAEPFTLLCYSLADGRELWRRVVSFIDTVPPEQREAVGTQLAEARQATTELRSKEREYARLKRQLRKARLPPGEAKLKLEQMTAEVGRLKERLDTFDSFRPPDAIPLMGSAAATPVSDGRRIYAVFGSGVVVALDLQGQLVWGRFLGKPVQVMRGYHRGQTASPLLVDGTLVVAMNQLHGLDPETGASRWEGDTYLDYGASRPVRVGGVWYVATPWGELVRVSDGKQVLRGLASVYFNTPAVAGTTLYYVGAFGDPDTLDRQARAVRLSAKGDAVGATTVWEARLSKEKTYGCPLVHQGIVYTAGALGTTTALDAATGSVVWQQRVALGSDDVMSSPVVAGDRLVLMALSGKAAVLRAGRTFERLGGGTLEPTRATPTFAGGMMLVRGTERLWALEATP